MPPNSGLVQQATKRDTLQAAGQCSAFQTLLLNVKLCRLLDREIKEASKRQTLQAAWSCYAFTKLRQPPNVELCRPDIWMPANFS